MFVLVLLRPCQTLVEGLVVNSGLDCITSIAQDASKSRAEIPVTKGKVLEMRFFLKRNYGELTKVV